MRLVNLILFSLFIQLNTITSKSCASVKETFIPDDDGEVKKADEVIKEVIEEESVDGKDQTKLQGLRGESKSTSPKSYQIENK